MGPARLDADRRPAPRHQNAGRSARFMGRNQAVRHQRREAIAKTTLSRVSKKELSRSGVG